MFFKVLAHMLAVIIYLEFAVVAVGMAGYPILGFIAILGILPAFCIWSTLEKTSLSAALFGGLPLYGFLLVASFSAIANSEKGSLSVMNAWATAGFVAAWLCAMIEKAANERARKKVDQGMKAAG